MKWLIAGIAAYIGAPIWAGYQIEKAKTKERIRDH